jgi:hypothetical protein
MHRSDSYDYTVSEVSRVTEGGEEQQEVQLRHMSIDEAMKTALLLSHMAEEGPERRRWTKMLLPRLPWK